MIEDRPPHPAASKQRHWYQHRWWIVIGILMVAAVLGVIFAPRFIDHQLESDDARDFIARHTAGELNMPAGYLPLTWDGLHVRTEGLWARSEGPEHAREMRAHEIQADSSLSQLKNHRWRVKSLSVHHLDMAFGTAAMQHLSDPFANPPELLQPDAADAATPWDAEIEKLSIQHTNLLWGQEEKSFGGLFDSVTEGNRLGDGHYRIQGHGGTMRQNGCPDLQVRSFNGSYADKMLTIEASQLLLGDKDEINLTGHICDNDQSGMKLELRAHQCNVTPLLPETTRNKFSGTFTTDASIVRSLASAETKDRPNKKESDDKDKAAGKSHMKTEVNGKIAFANATIRRISALERAAEFTSINRFRHLDLDVLEGTYVWSNGQLEVKDFVLEARGLLRVEGSFTVQNQSLRGTFQLGLSAEVVENFPGAQGTVFNHHRGSSDSDYSWATLHLTGSLDHPEEDLKPRLVAAAKAYYAKKFLAPLLKPGKLVLEAIESLY